MKKCMSVILAVFILLLSGIMLAERNGAEVIIRKNDGRSIRGELIAVKKSSLLVLGSQSQADESADIGDIKEIRFLRKSRAKEGLIIGGIGGALIGLATYQEPKNTGWITIDFGPGANAAGGGLLGIAVGGIIGAIAGKDQTIQIEGKSQEEINKILKDISKKSRIPDFQ